MNQKLYTGSKCKSSFAYQNIHDMSVSLIHHRFKKSCWEWEHGKSELQFTWKKYQLLFPSYTLIMVLLIRLNWKIWQQWCLHEVPSSVWSSCLKSILNPLPKKLVAHTIAPFSLDVPKEQAHSLYYDNKRNAVGSSNESTAATGHHGLMLTWQNRVQRPF